MTESAPTDSGEQRLERLEEALWVARAQAGEPGAFANLLNRYEKPLLYYLRRLVPRGDAALDLHQEINGINPVERVAFAASLDSIIPARHCGGTNMLLADSHTEWAGQAQWIATNSAARMRWNNDHQPHVETW